MLANIVVWTKCANITDQLLMLFTEREIGPDINGHNGQEQALGKVQKRKVFALISVFCICQAVTGRAFFDFG